MFSKMHTNAGKQRQNIRKCLCLQFSFSHTGRIFALKKKAKGDGHVWKEFKAEFNANETEDDVTIEWNNNDGGRKGMYPRTTDTTTKVTISIMFLLFGQIYLNLWTNIFDYLDKYI